MYGVDTATLIKIGQNLVLMFSLSLIMMSAFHVGLVDWFTRPLDRIRSNRAVLLFWLLFTSVITAFLLDTLCAILIVPFAMLYAEKRSINKQHMLLTIGFGSVVANDFTYFGGGDTVIAWTQLQKLLGQDLTISTWLHLFAVPTLFALVITCVWMWFKVFEKKQLDPVESKPLELGWKSIVSVFLLAAGIYFAFKEWYLPIIELAAIFAIFVTLPLDKIKRLPYKAIIIWTVAIIAGNFINAYIKAHYTFQIPDQVYSLLGILIAVTIVSVLTNVVTNTGLTAIILPVIMAIHTTDQLWVFVLVVKCISLSYLTIFANGCLAVAAGYGLEQKSMIRAGVPILILQIIFLTLYFYFMRGHVGI